MGSRYAGAMLLHAFFDRVRAQAVFAPLAGAGPVSCRSRRCDDVALLTATTVAFALGVGSVEATKHLVRDQIGPLAGLDWLPELRTLRPAWASWPGRVIGTVASVESKIRQAWLMRRRCRRVPALRSSFAGFRFRVSRTLKGVFDVGRASGGGAA